MTTNPTSRRELRALAEAATPGPWRYGVDIDQVSDAGKGYPLDYYPDCRTIVEISCRECGERTTIAEQDAAFIAAAHPQAVLELLNEVDRLSFYETTSAADAIRQLTAIRAALAEACELAINLLNGIGVGISASERIRELRTLAATEDSRQP